MPPRQPTDALGASLDLLILKTLSLEPMQGWGISRRAPGEELETGAASPRPRK